ncbi:MAG: V-type ATP synthase subunit I [Candidatus Scalinduaceae bacterium]
MRRFVRLDMAIDSVKKVTVIAPSSIKEKILAKLYGLRVIHVIDAFSKEHEKVIKRIETKADEPDENINKLNIIRSTFELFAKRKKDFFESFFPLPLLARQSEFNNVLTTFDIDILLRECKQICDEYHSLSTVILYTESELKDLSLFLDLPYRIEELKGMEKVEAKIGIFSHTKLSELSNDYDACEILTWQVIGSDNRKIKTLIFYLKKERDKATKLLEKYNITTMVLPDISGDIEERIDFLKKEIANLTEKQIQLKNRVIELSKYYNEVEIMLSYWENQRDKARAENNIVKSNRMLVISGYIREKDVDRLERILSNEFPGISSIYDAPCPKENVPVSITLNKFFKPVQLLTNMFGLPNYFNFDPTPFLTLGFLLFFGICFGDVIYGLMLMSFSYYIIRKYKNYEGIGNFFKLFFYAGISTTVIGALTGGWAGDIYGANYLGENNLLMLLRNSLMIIDPLARPIIALVFAIGLGILNQFYGISLRMYGELRKGNVGNAIFDCVLWLIFLPGIIIITIPLFIKIPNWVFNTGLYMIMGSAIGLVLTQGRNEKTWIGKILIGFVSMYGILGTYGCTSFISDILSYSRLLALGLTTSIIAMSINIIADIVRSINIIGIGAFILILILGHTFNFLVCIISSFVHPARLIFLEFFGRFYQGAAIKFRPYGFSSKRIQVINLD